MADPLRDLLEILQAEIREHEALERELEQEAVLDGMISAEALMRIQTRKNERVHAIGGLEERRMAIVAALAGEWNEPAAELTLRRIIARAPQTWGPPLQHCYDTLQRLVRRIRELAEITGNNAQSRLKAIDATLEAIKEAMKLHATYSEQGRLHKQTPTLKSTSA